MAARTRPLPTKPAKPVWPWLLLTAVLLGLLSWGYRVVTQPSNPAVQARALGRTPAQNWQALRAFGPRPVGSKGHDRAVDWLETQFSALGYRVTRQDVPLTRSFDLGGSLRSGQTVIPVAAIYGAAGGEQTAKLVRVPPQASAEQLRQLPVQTNIALTTCPGPNWKPLVEAVMTAGAFGLVVIDDCPTRRWQKVDATPLPLVQAGARDKGRLLALAGQTVTLRSQVEERPVTGHNLVAARVKARPEVLLGAHLDTVNGSLGANDNSSGVLSVLEAARQAVNTPLADHTWFVLFDAEEDGTLGSRAFVRQFGFPLHSTRAMLNFDMVGVDVRPLGAAIDPEVLPLARQVRPTLRVFEDEPVSDRKILGRFAPPTGRSDHLHFKLTQKRTVFLHRGEDVNYHAPTDQTLQTALVQDTADFGVALARAVLKADLKVKEPCRIGAPSC
ncbi:M28 family peptidase [Deinococcus fonticola]|uniref:M28 family peptidase n=1 Tax=Deinococcus fonticola TaxID=2528713 RepID=UPI001F0E7CEB|nr:M28 family peptidase [Deinococcus fonticola]